MAVTSQQRPRRASGFFWQACLILGPVVVLAVVGASLLRQDKRLVRQEAREQAEILADELAQVLWVELADTRTVRPGWVTFTTDAGGGLIRPAPLPPLPLPDPLPVEELSAGQSNLWQAFLHPAQTADPDGPDPAPEAFLESGPPERFVAAAYFKRGMRLARNGDQDRTVQAFDRLLHEHAEARGETGVPLRPLAFLKLLEGLKADPPGESPAHWLDLICSNAVVQPTLLTPLVLEKAAAVARGSDTNLVMRWQDEWARDQTARSFHTRVRQRPGLDGNPGRPGSQEVDPLFLLEVEVESELMPGKPSPAPEGGTPGRAGRREPEREPLVPVTDLVSNIYADERIGGILQHDPASTATFFRFNSEWVVIRRNGLTNTSEFLCRPLQGFLADLHLARSGPPVPELRWKMIVSDAGSVTGHAADAPSFPVRLAQILKRMPAYMDISLTVAGRTIISADSLPSLVEVSVGKGGGTHWGPSPAPRLAPPEILATGIRPGAGSDLLQLGVHLASPELLFAHQRTRLLWFGLLIGGSGLAALTGLGAAWRAFHKQRRLAELQTNFVSSVSHELRAPIASVRLMAEGLERGTVPNPDKQQDYYRFIVQECRRLSGMIENVLDYARIEQGRKDYEFEPTDLDRLVRDTVKLMEPAAAEAGVSLILDLSPAPDAQPIVDGSAIQQALVNLIDNAIKHSPAGGKVEVSLRHQPPNSLLAVSDQGPGIPPEERERVFERFYRRGSELRRETTGVGIGLSIVRHVVLAHRGRVWVESGPGRGSRFVMELPLVREEEP